MKKYYQSALEQLRTLGARFAETHPTIAPLLNSQSADPDVERILEGTAFLCGLIEERLDQNFPEVVHTLLEIVAPHVLLPVPSQTIVQFTPLPQVQGVQHVSAGVQLNSDPIGNTVCPFTVMRPLNILPITSTHTRFESSRPKEGTLSITLTSPSLVNTWLDSDIPFYINAPYTTASQWHMLLLQHVRAITLTSGGQSLSLPAKSFRFTVPPQNPFAQHSPATDFALLREYFAFPEKFLYVTLTNIKQGMTHGSDTNLRIDLHLQNVPDAITQNANNVSPNLLLVNTVPAMNVFPHTALPFFISHTRQDYPLQPEGDSERNMSIYQVRDVTGIRRGGHMRKYSPYSSYEQNNNAGNTYSLRRITSIINGQQEYFIGLLHKSKDELLEDESLTAKLLCYHHTMPAVLMAGNVRVPTDSSPAMANFTNLIKPTVPTPPPSNPHILWQLFSHIHTNLLPLASAKSLQECLRLYAPINDSDTTNYLINKKRIESIKNFSVSPEEMLYKGRLLRGQRIFLDCDSTGFASLGEMYLFGGILEHILGHCAPLNTFIRLYMRDTLSGETFTWNPRLGSKALL